MKGTLLSLLLAGGLALAVKALPGGWIRYVSGAPAAGAFLTLENPSSKALRLIRAETPVAERVSLHITHMHQMGDQQVMHMYPVDSFEIPPHGRLELKPGGKHLMLEKLKRPLKVGEKIPLLLRFSDGSTLRLELPVEMR
ncbi:MAG: transporter [Thermus sp.]|uniref:copper chaperone PCu(A)C n=1 Tax=Thermus sp. TaxID=275 RepID=UPI0033327763